MKKSHVYKKGILKIFVITLLTLLLCLGAWCFLNMQISDLKQNYISSISNGNEFALKTLVENIQSSENISDAVEIIKKAPTTGTRHWFILSKDSMIFERNTEYTQKISELNIDELKDFYVRNGGTGIDKLFDLIKTQENFSAAVLKDRTYDREIINYNFIEINNEKYCIGTGVIENYMFSLGKIGESIFYLRILTSLLCLLVLLLMTYHLYSNNKKTLKINKLNNQITKNNILIHKNSTEFLKPENNELSSTEDEIADLYNKQFFDAIIEKLTERKIENIGIIVIKIKNYEEITSKNNNNFKNNLINSVSESLKNYATEKDICSRITKDEFSIIKIDTTKKATIKTATRILKELSSNNPLISFTTKTSFKTEKESLLSAVKEVSEIS